MQNVEDRFSLHKKYQTLRFDILNCNKELNNLYPKENGKYKIIYILRIWGNRHSQMLLV